MYVKLTFHSFLKTMRHIKDCQWCGGKGGHAVVQVALSLEGSETEGQLQCQYRMV